MNIIDHYISTLNFDTTVKDVRQGVFHTAVLTRNCGLAASLPKVREKTKELWVIEKNPREDDFDETQTDRLIPMADLVAITGTALTNHTIESLLSLCRPEAFVILLGDTAPLSPVLFEHGVDAVSGTKVIDHDLVLKCVSQGANFRQIKGTRRLTLLR